MEAYNYCLVFQNINNSRILQTVFGTIIASDDNHVRIWLIDNCKYFKDHSYTIIFYQIGEIDQTIINAIKEL